MKKLLSIFLLLNALCQVYSQNYDLIVKSNGDSIACHIDSITVSHIYFEMKSRDYWTHTRLEMNEVSEFKESALNKNIIPFKPGTSILLRSEQLPPGLISIREIPKNSIVLATDFLFSITGSYERLVPMHNAFGLMLRAGTGITGESDDPIPLVFMGQVSTLLGTSRHFLETGVGYYQSLYHNPSYFPLIGYRYMAYKGFSFKTFIKISYFTEESWIDEWGQGNIGFGFSIGYRFWL